MSVRRIDVYLECGRKRTFAGALDWPGWCRSGTNESEALDALLACAPKYAAIVAGARLGFAPPKSRSQLDVVERLPDTATTDFGAPGVPPTVDRDRSCGPEDLKRFGKVLRAAWQAFDGAVEAARGKPLATGPRGGGRSLEKIVSHVVEADAAYLRAVGWKAPNAGGPAERIAATRGAMLDALEASAAGRIPARGPRGGVRWTARYFVRRVAWHAVAHAWEIERRAGLRLW